MDYRYCLLLIFSTPVIAAPIGLQDVLKSTRTHYPAINQARDNVLQAEASLRNSQGAFDMRVVGDNYWVTTGYYKRHLNEVKLEKPLGVMGSKVYSSYSKAFPGLFPPQYSTMSTNSGGQAMLGGSVSLIKNALLDEPRARIKSNEIGVAQAHQDLEWSKLQVSKEGALLYWNWLAHTRIFYIYSSLLDRAVKRDEILVQRVQKGDTSEIVRKENLQYLSRRKAELASAEMELKKSSIDLSLYLRDDQGKMIVPQVFTFEEVTQGLVSEEIKVKQELSLVHHEGLASKIIDLRPDFKKLQLDIDKNEIEYKMGHNDLLPALDIGADFTRYMGQEDPTNAAHIMQLNLKFVIPMEYELGLGRKQAAGAQRRVLSSQLNFMKENISNELDKYQEVLKLSQQKVENARSEVKYAQDLLEAEYIRFKNGNSNLFVVNLREENLVSAEENETHAITELLQIYSEFKVATLQL
ncbi:MAG: TolC family protein [Bacteriovoracaceae bacterium]